MYLFCVLFQMFQIQIHSLITIFFLQKKHEITPGCFQVPLHEQHGFKTELKFLIQQAYLLYWKTYLFPIWNLFWVPTKRNVYPFYLTKNPTIWRQHFSHTYDQRFPPPTNKSFQGYWQRQPLSVPLQNWRVEVSKGRLLSSPEFCPQSIWLLFHVPLHLGKTVVSSYFVQVLKGPPVLVRGASGHIFWLWHWQFVRKSPHLHHFIRMLIHVVSICRLWLHLQSVFYFSMIQWKKQSIIKSSHSTTLFSSTVLFMITKATKASNVSSHS